MRPDGLSSLPGPVPSARAVETGISPEEIAALRDAAAALEATFLGEMLKTAGLGETPASFGGGAGEEQFASFLRDEQANAMVEAGGIGLAEAIFRSLVERQHG